MFNLNGKLSKGLGRKYPHLYTKEQTVFLRSLLFLKKIILKEIFYKFQSVRSKNGESFLRGNGLFH